MAKGMFTQAMCMLTTCETTIGELKSALIAGGFEIAKEMATQNDLNFGGATLIVPYRPKSNGYLAVDVVNEPWPDSMGDPKQSPMLFGAWSMGHFGPLAYPGGLERAIQHAWSWPEAKSACTRHGGFVRARMSYAFGAKDTDPIFPVDYDALDEMMFLNRVVDALFEAPGVLCYFNPNGEILRDCEGFRELSAACARGQFVPLQLWSNVRFFNLNESFCFMDTVGNGQLDIADVEAIFPTDAYDPGDVDYYLRNVTHYLLHLGREIKSGERFDGPGENNLSWMVEVLDDGLMSPPRRVIRLFPKSKRREIGKLVAAAEKRK